MQQSEYRAAAGFGAAVISGALLLYGPGAQAQQKLPDDVECHSLKSDDRALNGWCTAINNRKGNCLACHRVTTRVPWPESLAPGGNVAPPLAAMKARFPERAKLREQLYDATRAVPFSVMPPFGKHRLLSDEELDNVVEWLYTL